MNKAFEPEVIKKIIASTSPEQRVGIERRAADIRKRELSVELDNAKFVAELGWLAALSVTICAVAVL